MLAVADNTDGRRALEQELAKLAAGHAHKGELAFAGHQLSADAGGTHKLSAAAGLKLDVVNERAVGHVLELLGVAGADISLGASHDRIADLQLIGADDVALLAVDIEDQSKTGTAVGIVFDRSNAAGDADLVALEVNDAEQTDVTAADKAHRSAAVVVAAAGSLLSAGKEGALRLLLGDVLAAQDRHVTSAGSVGIELFDCHFQLSSNHYAPAPSKNWICSPSASVMTAFFQARLLPRNAPMRLGLECTLMV